MSCVVIVTNGREPQEAIAALAPQSTTVAAIVWGRRPHDAEVSAEGGGEPSIWLEDVTPGAIDRLVTTLLPEGLTRVLRASAAGRVIHSLLPIEHGRRVWRRVRRSPQALAMLSSADLVIASDPGGVRTAWFAHHRLGAARATIAGLA